jgi:hypothetical protein
MNETPDTEGLNSIKVEIRKEAREQLAKWVIGGVVVLVSVAATGWWLYLQPKIDDYIRERSNGLPSGAIVAFKSSESDPCPGRDWEIFEEGKGRFLLGAGHQRGSELTQRILGDVGGEEEHTLSESEIPSHDHGMQFSLGEGGDHQLHWANHPSVGNKVASPSPGTPPNTPDTSVGEGRPHNNMPPFISLYFCRKL